MPDDKARLIVARRMGHVIVLALTDDGWVGIIAAQNRVRESFGAGRSQGKDAKKYGEYEIFNRTQPIESDFDKVVKKMLEGKS